MAASATKASASAVAAADSLRVFTGRFRRRLQDVSAVGGLNSSQASALARIAQHEPSSASELAGAERVRPQSMAATLNALHDQGLIRRSPDPTDGRRQQIQLTAKGRSYAQGARATRSEWLVNVLQERFSESERATIAEALTLLERVVEP